MKEINTYLPLTDNDKNVFPKSVIDGIIEELTMKYGGCSVGSQGMGYWVNDEGSIDEDQNIMIAVAVSDDQLEMIKADVVRIGKLLKQDAMYFKVIDCDVDILDC